MTDLAVAHGHDADVIGLDAVHDGPAPKRIVTGYGFWIFLLSDMVMFSCFFAAYAVLLGQTAGGPSGAQLFNLKNVAIETACLLLSSFACGMASIAAEERNHFWFQIAMAVTCVLGLAFLCDRIPRIRRPRRARRRPLAQRLPVGLLHAGRLPRPACLGRHPLAAHHDGAGVRQGLSRRHPAPLPLLCAVLARARHHLGRGVFGGLSARECGMSDIA